MLVIGDKGTNSTGLPLLSVDLTDNPLPVEAESQYRKGFSVIVLIPSGDTGNEGVEIPVTKG